jgi:phosphatidylglycerol:prolipoprotein diacylglycerol transferase
MIPYFQFINFSLGPIKIQVWGLMVSLGIIAALLVAYYLAKKRNLNYKKIPDLAFWVILSALIGSRILFILTEWKYYLDYPGEMLKFWQGGMSISGGLIFGVLAGYFFCRHHHYNFIDYAEVVAFSMPLGLFIGRLGCFLIYDHPGTQTSFFFGQEYIDGIVRHNHGLYLSLEGLILFIIFFIIYKIICKDVACNVFTIYLPFFLIFDGLTRLILDFWRINDTTYFYLTIAQYLGILMIGLGIYLLCDLTKKQIKLLKRQ